MTLNDAYKYARQLRRWAWRNRRGPWMHGYEGVQREMLAQGYTDADFLLVRLWLKTWGSGRRYFQINEGKQQ